MHTWNRHVVGEHRCCLPRYWHWMKCKFLYGTCSTPQGLCCSRYVWYFAAFFHKFYITFSTLPDGNQSWKGDITPIRQTWQCDVYKTRCEIAVKRKQTLSRYYFTCSLCDPQPLYSCVRLDDTNCTVYINAVNFDTVQFVFPHLGLHNFTCSPCNSHTMYARAHMIITKCMVLLWTCTFTLLPSALGNTLGNKATIYKNLVGYRCQKIRFYI